MRYAASTVAMTLYNLIAQARNPLTAEQLHAQAIIVAHPDVTLADVLQVLCDMEERRLTRKMIDDTYYCPDARRRRVIGRDRTDAQILYDGVITGGWVRWVLQDGTPIGEVL